MPVHGIDNGNNKKDVYTTEEVLSILQQAIDSGTLQGIDPDETPIVAAVRESHNNSDVTFWSGTEAEFNELTGVTSELVGARIGSDGKLYLLTGDTTLSDTVEAARQAALEATEGMKREVISVTLLANGWSNTAPYTQTVAVAGMTADKDFLAPYVVPTGNESDDIAAQVALSCISGGSTDTDSVTFYCYDEKPTTTITVFMVDKGTKIESGDFPIASKTEPGIMKVGDGLNVDENGEVSVAGDYPIASNAALGFVKVGDGLAVDQNGEVSVEGYGEGGIIKVEDSIASYPDATNAIQGLIDSAISSNKTLIFPDKAFNITSIDFKTVKARFINTVFNAIGGDVSAIKITNPFKGSKFSHFTLNGNQHTGIELTGNKNIKLSDILVNACKIGIKVNDGYEVTISDSLIRNIVDIEDSVGLQVNNDDSVYSNIVIQGFRTGVKTTSNCLGDYFDKIHIWSTIAATVLNSVGFELYRGINMRDCVFDTCLIGVKVTQSGGKIDLNNCRWIWNTNFINDTILDGAQIELFDFADADCTEQVFMHQCYGYKPSGISSIDFSNLLATDWKGICNVVYNNKGLSGASEVPYGYVDSLATPSSLTDVTNQIIASETGVNIDYVGLLDANASTGEIILGTMDKSWERYNVVFNTFAVYGDQWNAPEGFVYCYVTKGGQISIKATSAMLGKYIKLHLSFSR